MIFMSFRGLAHMLLSFTLPSLAMIALTGCITGTGRSMPAMEEVKYSAPAGTQVQKRHEGSLWQEGGALSELFINTKARRVGDIVTISIVETSSATNGANTDTSRESSMEAGIDNLFNLEKKYESAHPFFNPFNYTNRTAVKGGIKSEFGGQGTTSRNGTLNARITARVTEIMPNGDLKIMGAREITVNNETQYIVMSGIVRPRDISPDNVVLSTYVSDARIAYSGTGVINDRQKPGWLANILNKVWPF
jgi:flagellar L-ring protein FlgH